MQIKGRDYQVLYTKESKEVQVALDLLSMVEHKSLTVEYKERKAFLTPFIPLLINPQKEHGLKGVSPFAKLLHLLVNFMDADGSGNTLNPDCIEDEIYKLFNELDVYKRQGLFLWRSIYLDNSYSFFIIFISDLFPSTLDKGLMMIGNSIFLNLNSSKE